MRCARASAVTWQKIRLDRYQQTFVIGKSIDIDSFSIACEIIEYPISITAKNIIEYPITIMQVSKKVMNINNKTVLNNYSITPSFNTKGLLKQLHIAIYIHKSCLISFEQFHFWNMNKFDT